MYQYISFSANAADSHEKRIFPSCNVTAARRKICLHVAPRCQGFTYNNSITAMTVHWKSELGHWLARSFANFAVSCSVVLLVSRFTYDLKRTTLFKANVTSTTTMRTMATTAAATTTRTTTTMELEKWVAEICVKFFRSPRLYYSCTFVHSTKG